MSESFFINERINPSISSIKSRINLDDADPEFLRNLFDHTIQQLFQPIACTISDSLRDLHVILSVYPSFTSSFQKEALLRLLELSQNCDGKISCQSLSVIYVIIIHNIDIASFLVENNGLLISLHRIPEISACRVVHFFISHFEACNTFCLEHNIPQMIFNILRDFPMMAPSTGRPLLINFFFPVISPDAFVHLVDAITVALGMRCMNYEYIAGMVKISIRIISEMGEILSDASLSKKLAQLADKIADSILVEQYKPLVDLFLDFLETFTFANESFAKQLVIIQY